MGFGKFLVGGLCAVGAVVAAPVALPAMGMAVAASSLTGAVGVTAGLAIASASTATVVGTAAVAGATGVAIAGANEKRNEELKDTKRQLEEVKIASQNKDEASKRALQNKDIEISACKQEIKKRDKTIDDLVHVIYEE